MKNLLIFIFAFCIGVWSCKAFYGTLVFYGADIFYVDVNRLSVGTESGTIDTSFNSFNEMSQFLENKSADALNDMDDYNLKMSLLDGQAEILPNGRGIEVRAGNLVILLDRTDDGYVYYNEE